MLGKLAIILPLIIALMWKLSGLLKMSGLGNKHIGFLGLVASAILTFIVIYNRQAPLQQLDAVVSKTQKTQCSVLESDIRESSSGDVELWLRVSWEVNDQSYQVKEPVQWLIQRNSASNDELSDYATASHISCRYIADNPSAILPDAAPILEKEIESFQWKFIVCALIAILSLRTIMMSYRRRERAVSSTRLRSATAQLMALGTCGLVLATKPIGTWFWGSTAVLCLCVWFWVIWREFVQELGLPPAIRERMDEYDHWPNSPTNDSGIDLYSDDRIQGTWNGVSVRIAPGNDQVRIEADVPNWPPAIFLGRRGSRSTKPSPLGDEEFDKRMHLETHHDSMSGYPLEVLTPAARIAALRAIDDLGAALEECTLSAILETDILEIVLEQLEDIVEAARILNLHPSPPEERLKLETSPALKLRLAKLQDPMPRDVLKSIQDDELASLEVRRAAFSLLNPGDEGTGLVSLTMDDGKVSPADDSPY